MSGKTDKAKGRMEKAVGDLTDDSEMLRAVNELATSLF